MSPVPDHELLGVVPSASLEELKTAYRKACMRAHPDRHGGDNTLFREVTEAYERLTKQPCSECQGKGHVVTRRGMFATRNPCPKCWGSS